MRRVLVDECLPIQLHRWLQGLDVRTVEFMGWKGKRNSDLLNAAKGRFDVLLTGDGFLAREHDLASYGLAIVVLATNRLGQVERLVPEIAEAVANVRPGEQMAVPTRQTTSGGR